MADRERLYTGLSHAAWGYFFLIVKFTIVRVNTVPINIIPPFAGWLLFRSAIGRLEGERRDLALLRPLCTFLALWSLTDWILTFLGTGLDGRFLVIDLLVAVASLYFHFQFLTDLSALASTWQKEGGDLDRRLLRRRTAFILLTTAVDLVLTVPLGEAGTWVGLTLAVLCFIEALVIMFDLFELRRIL